MIGRYLANLCSDTDPDKALYPLTQRYVSEQLHHGKFQGLGSQIGRRWLLDADRSNAGIIEQDYQSMGRRHLSTGSGN